jgi:hypothetical protein
MRAGKVCSQGHAQALGKVLNDYQSLPLKIAGVFRFSALDSSSVAIIFLDSVADYMHRLSFGQDSAGALSPGILTLTTTSISDRATIIARHGYKVTDSAPNIPFQLILTVGDSGLIGELRCADTLVTRLRVDTLMPRLLGVRFQPGTTYEGIELNGTAAGSACAENFIIKAFSPSYQFTEWRWSDSAAIEQDSIVRAAGVVMGAPRNTWMGSITTSKQRITRLSMTVRFASIDENGAAVRMIDSTADREYWVALGSVGVGASAAGSLSAIITGSRNEVLALSEAQKSVDGLVAGRDYHLVMILDKVYCRAELYSTDSTLLAEISTAVTGTPPIVAGAIDFLHPCMKLVGTPTNAASAVSFYIESQNCNQLIERRGY